VILRAISSLVFLIGSLAILGAGTIAWLYIVVALVKSLGWPAGMIAFVATLYGIVRFESYVKLPWLLWLELWSWADARIATRPAPPPESSS